MKAPACYSQWWQGKLCRADGSTGDFKRVERVEWIGAPSGVYGFVVLHYCDGTDETISRPDTYRPRKSDVEVKDETVKQ